MDLGNLSVFALANQNMKYLTEKERVVAENLANANTPGYLSKDVEKPNFAGEVTNHLKMTATNPMHMSGIGRGTFQNKVYTPTPTSPLTIDGNGVIIEDQLNEASKASGEYGRMISIYTQYRNMLSTANTKINI